MNFIAALGKLTKHSIAGPIRYLRAVLEHPNVTFYPGVRIGRECRFGRNVSILSGATIAETTLGDHSYVGEDSTLKNCRIGKFCSIAPCVRIGLGIHPTDRISTYPGFYSKSASGATKYFADDKVVESRVVVIGNDVWIGVGAVVSDGVVVGDGAVIAAGAVVTSHVASYAIVAGVPAKEIRRRFEPPMVDFLLRLRWWDMDDARLRQYAHLFGDPEGFRKSMEVFRE